MRIWKGRRWTILSFNRFICSMSNILHWAVLNTVCLKSYFLSKKTPLVARLANSSRHAYFFYACFASSLQRPTVLVKVSYMARNPRGSVPIRMICSDHSDNRCKSMALGESRTTTTLSCFEQPPPATRTTSLKNASWIPTSATAKRDRLA